MINGITNLLTSNTMVNIAQSTRTAMSIETGLKATGRPAFIMWDKNISPETKQYAAVKELIYQLTCLAVYMGIVMPVFRKGGFQFFKHVVFRNKDYFKNFENLNQFSSYHHLKSKPKAERINFINDTKNKDIFTPQIKQELSADKVDTEKYCIVKGADEVSSILGSILGLAVLAPQVSHVTIHPILKTLGLEKEEHK